MTITQETLKKYWQTTPDTMAKDFTTALEDFGYPVTQDWVKTQIAKFYNGDILQCEPGRFISEWLTKGFNNT